MFDKLSGFTKKVSDLPDQPTLAPNELKNQFDAAPEELRVFVNNLIDEIKSTLIQGQGEKTQKGRVTNAAIVNDTARSIRVNFPEVFTEPPEVFVTSIGSNNVYATVFNPSQTGFTLYLTYKGTTNTTIENLSASWLAIGK